KLILSELSPLVGAQHGAFFIMGSSATPADAAGLAQSQPNMIASYAYRGRRHLATRFAVGESLVGQCALEREPILLTEVPDDYVRISSGLGEATPSNIIVLPVLFEGQVKAVIELASFQRFSQTTQTFLDQLSESI